MDFTIKQYRRLLRVYLFPLWPQLIILSLALIIGLALSLINPLLIGRFIDALRVQASLAALLRLASLFFFISLVIQALSLGESFMAGAISLRATNNLRADLMVHCLQLDPYFHAQHMPGELIERIDGDVERLTNFFSRFLVSLVGNALLFLGVIVMFFLIDWRVGLILTFTSTLWVGAVVGIRKIAANAWERLRQASADVFGFLEERIGGAEDVRSSGATSYMMRGLAVYSRTYACRLLATFRLGYFAGFGMIFMSAIQVALALLLGVLLFTAHQITLGTVYTIFSYTTLLHTPVETLTQQLRDLQQMTGSVIRIQALLDTQSVIQDGVGLPLPASALSVEFADVSFRYIEDAPVLKHVSFTLAPGQVMGLLGRTGSGKSTLVKLLMRLYDPCLITQEAGHAGSIRLSGIDLRDLTLEDLRTKVAMISQEVHILHATLRDNLTLFNHTIEDHRIIAALEELGLSSWFLSLPDGLDTVMTAGGSGLSAGEAQLLAFARVFLRDAGLVILDEASSRLDPATERLLERAINRLLEGRTAIIIAHRLATVQRADMIMLLEDGVCVEAGMREALASESESRYARLLRIGLEEVLA